MRTIGKAEKALDLMVHAWPHREAFGKKIAHLGGNMQIIAQARCEIEAMRLMVLKAAKAMDVLGNKEPASGSPWSRPWCRSAPARSSTSRSRCTAPPASRTGRRSPRCTRTSATCASPTVRTRCTGWSSGRHELSMA
jgi:alkylation response protein AidB-like acyl-CoA dehydrogenase